MLLFSTMFDVNDTMTKEKFVDLVIEWNDTGSRASNVIPGIKWGDSFGTRFGSDSLWLRIDEDPKNGIVAAHHEKTSEDGTVWRTDYVMNFLEMRMSVRFDRSYQEDALRIDADFSTPHFITHLIAKGYLKDDGGLPILRVPVEVSSSCEAQLSAAINEPSNRSLPILCVSRNHEGHHPLDIGLLASKVKGVAHVFVEGPGSCTDSCDADENELFAQKGCVTIHFPNPSIAPITIIALEADDGRSMLSKTIRPVVQYSNSRAVDPLYTWDGVQNSLLTEQLAVQHERTATAIAEAKDSKDFLAAFEEDYAQLEDKIRNLQNRVAVLEAENAALRSRASASPSTPLLLTGDEADLFDGEVKDLVLSTLASALKNIPAASRRHDVVSDVIKNNDYRGECQRRTDQMKKLMKDLDPTAERFERGLEKLGFVTATTRST